MILRGSLLVLSAAALLFAETGCRRAAEQSAETAPFYVRGLKLRDGGDFTAASVAFRECLRRNPNLAEAHLQLALLYEDHLDRLPDALYHYRQYLRKSPSGPHAQLARSSLERVRRVRYETLRNMHEGQTGSAPHTDAQNVLHDRIDILESQKEHLLERMKELNRQAARLRQKLADAQAPPDPGAGQAGPGEDASASGRASLAGRSSTAAATPEQQASGANDVYIVKTGDTLSSICRAEYGSAQFWPHLLEANRSRLDNKNMLRPGMKLIIPPKTTFGNAND